MAQEYPLPPAAVPRFAPGGRQPLFWPLAGIAALITALVSAGILASNSYHREREAARLEALSSLRAGQISSWMAEKVAGLRLFSDADGKMNLGLAEVQGALLVISQFTLYGDTARGRRPSFIGAARPETAIPLYERFVAALRSRGLEVATGEFGADMLVEIHNDGPVTLILERA